MITVDNSERVTWDGSRVSRASFTDLDLCSSSGVLLFLAETSEPGVYRADYQGVVLVSGESLQAAEGNDIFDEYDGRKATANALESIVSQQGAANTPRGRILCEWKKASDDYVAPPVCPGDTFNPHDLLQLDKPMARASITTSDPGPGDLPTNRVSLEPGGAELSALLVALDVDTLLEGATKPADDSIFLSLVRAEPVDGEESIRFEYSPTSHRIAYGHGEFAAPEAFAIAMQPYVNQQGQD
jgi:hypothetical protein